MIGSKYLLLNEFIAIRKGRRVWWNAGALAPPKKNKRKKESLQKVSVLTFKLSISLLNLFFTDFDARYLKFS